MSKLKKIIDDLKSMQQSTTDVQGDIINVVANR